VTENVERNGDPRGNGHGGRRSRNPDRYKWLALSNTTIGTLGATINSSIVIISLPAIFRGIGINPLTPGNISYLLWMLLGYMLVSAVLVVTLGRLGDMFGRVKMYNVGFTIFGLAALALPFDPYHGPAGALWLIGWRIVQAVGGSMILANSPAILTDAFPSGERGMAMGINQVAAIAGQFIGLILGGVLAVVNWRLVFVISVPIGLGGALWSYLSLREIGIKTRARVDWVGNLTFGIGLIALLSAITYGIMPYGGHPMGWTNPRVIAGLIGGPVMLIVFCLIELKVKQPMFDLRLMRIRAFAAGMASQLLAAIARGGLQFMLIIWLQGIWLPLHGYKFEDTPLWSGIYLLPLTAGFVVSGPLSGWLSDKHGARVFASGGLLVSALGFGLLLLVPTNFNYIAFAVLVFVTGAGMGLFSAPNSAAIMNSVPARQRGAGAGMLSTFQFSGFVLSIGVFFSLMIAGLSSTLPKTMTNGLTGQGVPYAVAHKIGQLPPVSSLFAAFLGYNPVQNLLGPTGLLSRLSPSHVATLTGQRFFPQLITQPFHHGLVIVFTMAMIVLVIAAIASSFRGGRYVHEEAADIAPGGAALRAPAAGVSPALAGAGAAGRPGGQDAAGWPSGPQGGGGPAGNGWAADGADGRAANGHNGQNGHNGHTGGLLVAGRIRQANGSPANGAAVTLIDTSGRQAGRSSAGPDGSFRIGVRSAGLYTLITMAASHQPQASTVRVGELPVRHDVDLRGTSRLAGTAKTADGRVIPDARVMLLDAHGNVAAVTSTSPDGSYEFENLTPGEYTVVTSGYPPVAQPLRIASGEPRTHDPVLGHPES
jgi:MFS family permease